MDTMKPNELRIGNYVDLYGNIAQIQRADFSHKEHGIAIDSGKPIPLTEQWLKDFGFEYDEEFDCFRLNFHPKPPLMIRDYSKINYGFKVSYLWNFKKLQYIHDVYYVHQLQNLYFALTGEELKLNQTL